MLLSPGNTFDEVAGTEAGGVPAGLFYSSDTQPGFERVRKGTGFAYRDHKGNWLSDEAQIARIKKLAIPPAYESVWICASPNGHLQATGLDARGRKQYRYHGRWREERDSGKFDRMLAFARVLPRIRKKVKAHMQDNTHSRELVLATIVRLLDTTLVRVGNDQYARENKSFGLTTLRNRHVKQEGSCMRLSFRGKSGVLHDVEIKDKRVCHVVKRCLHLPGQELFQYKDPDGTLHSVSSGDVNDYLHELCGERFTAKDFRTWHGSELALRMLRRHCGSQGKAPTLKQLLAEVSGSLGNTPAVCRRAYIHPKVLELAADLSAQKDCADFDAVTPRHKPIAGLAAAEQRLVAFLS